MIVCISGSRFIRVLGKLSRIWRISILPSLLISFARWNLGIMIYSLKPICSIFSLFRMNSKWSVLSFCTLWRNKYYRKCNRSHKISFSVSRLSETLWMLRTTYKRREIIGRRVMSVWYNSGDYHVCQLLIILLYLCLHPNSNLIVHCLYCPLSFAVISHLCNTTLPFFLANITLETFLDLHEASIAHQ